MTKINVSLNAAREITEHYAVGGNVRAAERAAIAAAMPDYLARMGGVPLYNDMGTPVNGPAIIATAERKARLEARAIAAAERNAKAKAERIAAAARFAEEEHAKYLASLGPVTAEEVDSYLASVADSHTAEELVDLRAEMLADIGLTH